MTTVPARLTPGALDHCDSKTVAVAEAAEKHVRRAKECHAAPQGARGGGQAVSREAAARCPLAAGELPLLAVARLVPERGLTDLIARSQRVGDPVRVSLLHFTGCGDCTREALVGNAQLCARGGALVEACHAWRPRAAAGAETHR